MPKPGKKEEHGGLEELRGGLGGYDAGAGAWRGRGPWTPDERSVFIGV